MLVDQNVKVGKELQDVIAAVVVIVQEIKAGKSIVELGAAALPALINAVAGVDQVAAEVADRRVALVTLSLGTADLLDVLLPK